MLTIDTPRLELIAATADLLTLELEDPAGFAAALDARVSLAWPPGEYDRDAILFFRERLTEHPEHAGWYGWYAREREEGDLVGAVGYFGPPSEGRVEVGYSLVEAFRGQGFARELVEALVTRAREQGVASVQAHVQEANRSSIRVLERCGFSLEGPGEAPGSQRYVREA